MKKFCFNLKLNLQMQIHLHLLCYDLPNTWIDGRFVHKYRRIQYVYIIIITFKSKALKFNFYSKQFLL